MLKAGLLVKSSTSVYKEYNFMIISNNYINPITRLSLSDKELIEEVLLNSRVKSHKQRGFEELGVSSDLLMDFDKIVFITINPSIPSYKNTMATLTLSSAFFLRGEKNEAAKKKSSN